MLKPLAKLYEKENKRSRLHFFVEIRENSPVKLTASDEQTALSVTVSGEMPEKAQKREIDLDFVARQLSKLGDTIFELGDVLGEIESGLSVAASALNDLRRRAVCDMMTSRERFFAREIPFDDSLAQSLGMMPKTEKKRSADSKKDLLICAEKANVLRTLDLERISAAFLPLEEIPFTSGLDIKKLGLRLSEFVINEDKLFAETELLCKQYGITKALCANVSHIELAKKLNLEIYGGYTLNIFNSFAVSELKTQGVNNITLSAELKFTKINEINSHGARLGVVAYGRLPLMTMRNCPIGDCSRCKGYLADRTGRNFPVRCQKKRGFYQLLNADLLYAADKLDRVACDFVWLYFSDETPKQASKILDKFINCEPFDGAFTRGLYFRGIM